jgi:hypothetical protein
MRFYTGQHRHWCGIDLHARTLYVCILDERGQVLLHQNLRSSPEAFLEAIEPYRDGLVVAAGCLFTGYWLADLCAREGIAFVLGHVLYRKAIHGGKAKNDRVDALKIATLLRGGMLPQAYVCPAPRRTSRPYNLARLGKRISTARSRSLAIGRVRGRGFLCMRAVLRGSESPDRTQRGTARLPPCSSGSRHDLPPSEEAGRAARCPHPPAPRQPLAPQSDLHSCLTM